MSKLFTDAWKETLQNLSGKTIEGEFTQLVDLLDAFNATYDDNVTLSYALNDQADSHDADKLPQSVTVSAGTTVNVDFSIYPAAAQEGYEFAGWSTDPTGTMAEYTESGTNTIELTSNVTLFPVYAEEASGDSLTIVNESSEEVEIYYEIDKEEQGNTFIPAGSSNTISLDVQYPYYIRYSEGGSDNRHNFAGTYQGVSGYDTEVYYYDGNICPPLQESQTEWSFQSGDGGTLLVRDAK